MYSNDNKNKKIVTGFIVVFSVVILAVAVNMWQKHENASSTATASTHQSSNVDAGTSTATTATSNAGGSYKDGAFTATTSYPTPGGDGQMTIQLTVKSNAVTDINIQQAAVNHVSQEYENRFESAYKYYVVGKNLQDINLSRVSGASLTTAGFNDALTQIKSKAHA